LRLDPTENLKHRISIEERIMAEKIYDAIVVGSGANGGWAAKELCEAGMEVVMLEAGRRLDPATDFSEHVLPHDLPLRGRTDPDNVEMKKRPIGSRCYACGETNVTFFIDEEENPYTTAPGRPFWWIRGNQVGGRTILWARQSYRMSDYDFKAASHDGYGEDWPISYADVAPYYDTVERFIGVRTWMSALGSNPKRSGMRSLTSLTSIAEMASGSLDSTT